MKVKLTVEYQGDPFSGWQSQPGKLTVQGELERAFRVYLESQAKKTGAVGETAVSITGSGRTDAGVHARGQVASFTWPEGFVFDAWSLLPAINGITIPELVVLSIEQAPDDFDARHTPHLKRYSYTLLLRDYFDGMYRGKGWRVGTRLDLAAMITAARLFVGQHDFSSFRAKDCTAKSTVRTVLLSEITRVSRDELLYIVHGCGFLKQMIRILTGTLVRVGEGRLGVSDIPRIIEARDRALAGETAPAHGLTLDWVRYGEAPSTLFFRTEGALHEDETSAANDD